MKLNPYLYFPGTCKEAMTTYAGVLGGEVVAMMTYGDMPGNGEVPADLAEMIAHARVVIGEEVLMASDSPPGRYKPMQGAAVTLNIPEPAEADRVFAALIEGGTEIMPLTETFWAFKFGVFADRFGTQWMVNCMKPESA